MVKNITGGNKAKKGKRGGRITKNPSKEFDTDNGIYFYGQVKGKLGGNTLEVLLQTGETIHATIPGRFMRRVWFNKDDLIVVSNETAEYYDIIQKITNPATQIEAMAALNIKIDKDDSQIFQADKEEFDEEFDETENDKPTELSKAELNAMRKKKDKERDLQRRNGDNEDRVISVITNNTSEDEDENEDENEDEENCKLAVQQNESAKKNRIQNSSDNESSEEELELPKPVESKKKIVPQVTTPEKKSTLNKEKSTKNDKTDKTDKTVSQPVKKVIHYQETVEETASFLGL